MLHLLLCSPSLVSLHQITGTGGGGQQFPPELVTIHRQVKCLQAWKQHVSMDKIVQVTCAVCACLTLWGSICSILMSDIDLSPLICDGDGVMHVSCSSLLEPMKHILGPILEQTGVVNHPGGAKLNTCCACLHALCRHALPTLAFTNGHWVGNPPPFLIKLNWMEGLLVARGRKNCFVAHVTSQQRYMKANVLIFKQLVFKVYNTLPLPQEEFDDVLAIIFTGIAKPTNDDLKCTPFLICHRVVLQWLEWLLLNNEKY